MTQVPPGNELAYETPSVETGSARTLVQLAVIFGYVSSGLTLIAIGMQVLGAIITATGAFGARAAPPPGMPAFVRYMAIARYVLIALAVGVMALKVMGATWLLRRSPGAWGWGLAGSIAGCFELLWCSCGCIFPLAFGVYGIVILCLPQVREYLSRQPIPDGAGFDSVNSLPPPAP